MATRLHIRAVVPETLEVVPSIWLVEADRGEPEAGGFVHIPINPMFGVTVEISQVERVPNDLELDLFAIYLVELEPEARRWLRPATLVGQLCEIVSGPSG